MTSAPSQELGLSSDTARGLSSLEADESPRVRPPTGPFDRRCMVPELMDSPDIDEATHRGALRGLARLNLFSGTVAHVWRPIRQLAKREGLSRLSVADVATGGGDVPIALSRLAQRDGIELDATGIDVSEQALEFARSQARAKARSKGRPVSFRQADVLTDGLPGRYDVVVCSLFLHHLSESDSSRLLHAMKRAAKRLVIVNDLVRSRMTYWQVWAASRIVSRSHVVHHDGPASVRAAYSLDEAKALAHDAGLEGARGRHVFPARFVMTWSPTESE